MASAPRPVEASEHLQERQHAEATTGARVRDLHIREIDYRYRGADRHVCVGDRDLAQGTVVSAIFQLGRDGYTIHHRRADETLLAPIVLNRIDVYAVTAFD